MSNYNGFNRAAAAYENALPPVDECKCEEIVSCPNCGGQFYLDEGTAIYCPDCYEDGEDNIPTARYDQDVEGRSYLSASNCPSHAWCQGCYNPKCEDCN